MCVFVCREHPRHKQKHFLCLLHEVWLSVSLSYHHISMTKLFFSGRVSAIAKLQTYKEKASHSMESHFEITAVTVTKYDLNIKTSNLSTAKKE